MSIANPGIVLSADNKDDLQILIHYAEFWKIPYAYKAEPAGGDEQIVFSAGKVADVGQGTIVISPSTRDIYDLAERFRLTVETRETLVSLAVTRDTSVSLQTRYFSFNSPRLETVVRNGDVNILHKIRDLPVYLLSVSLVDEYHRLMESLEDRPSSRFRLVTKLPGSYKFVPSFLRNRGFRDPNGLSELREERIGPMECLRLLFLASLAIASDKPIPMVKFWPKGKEFALVVTHDVETKAGLEVGSQRLRIVEEKLSVRSTWNIPSDRYPLSQQAVSCLAMSGEVGGHDTKHDGRLILASFEDKVKRLVECKASLEKLVGREVSGFRSPLLQHSSEFVEALGRAGYTHDSSVPSWEILSPTSMAPHGIGTVFPFMHSGIVEVPVSLPQDHQLLRVAGLTPHDTVDVLHKLARWIRGLQGVCVLLIHPDYDFGQSENEEEYRRLLSLFTRDDKCRVLTVGELASWWQRRDSIGWWTTEDGHVRLSSTGVGDIMDDFHVALVTGYNSQDGLITEKQP